MPKSRRRKDRLDRRKFLEIASTSALGAGLGSLDSKAQTTARVTPQLIDNFNRTDSAYHGDAWETLTPGHWRIQWRALRQDMANCPDPPYGMLWHRAWKLTGDYRIEADITVRGLGAGDGHELFGICFGGRSLYEGWHGGGGPGQAAWYAAWRGDGSFGVYDHSSEVPRPLGAERAGLLLRPGARVTLTVTVSEGKTDARANLTVQVQGAVNGQVVLGEVSRAAALEGYFGLLARGDVDFEVNEVRLFPGRNRPEAVALSNLVVAMPMGHTLRKTDRGWRVKVLCLFRSEGERASVRVSDHPSPQWSQVPESGEAAIVTNRFRHHMAVVDTLLPGDPSEKEFTFTVWKDGTNVTADPRVPDTVGRLPRLRAPYRLCGLSCHAISAFQFSEPEKCFPWRVQQRRWHRISNPEVYPKARLFQEGWLFEQPRPESFQHIDEFCFQILLWEDDIWYLEIPIFPHTLADVYRLIGLTLGGKVQRRMMMRHWNVLDPGDHDFGMDDVKGTEQYAVRTLDSLPQDGEYLRRNFAAVLHLVTADEKEHRTDLPARYTRWQMPRGDFSLIITDARLWRTTQETSLWREDGWEGQVAWQRTDPTRTLLGEEQYAWLEKTIRTDPAPLIVVTGLNALHTVWGEEADQTSRVFADYAGFNRAACDRLLDLLSSREGILTVYGDVHLGSILRNLENGVVECSFGPIGRFGGRRLKPGFGSWMQDWDGRNLEVLALYHQYYEAPDLTPASDRRYWNFLDLTLDPDSSKPALTAMIRNVVDAPRDTPRGGGYLEASASQTGRNPVGWLPAFQVSPRAAVRVARLDGLPLRGGRAGADGRVRNFGLVEARPGEKVLVLVEHKRKASARILTVQATPS